MPFRVPGSYCSRVRPAGSCLTCLTSVFAWAVFACVACGDETTASERAALAREVAPSVRSNLATGAYVEVGGEPAVTIRPLAGPGDGAVQVLAGRSRPGAGERQCTELDVRLVPYGDRGRELLPIVADAFEADYGTRCGVP